MSVAYAGTELDLFAAATHWKRYLARSLAPHIRGRVLEVGAGIGGNVPYLCSEAVTRWTCLEPDPVLAGRIAERSDADRLPARCRVVAGQIGDLPPEERFDTILYIDVLEHIEADRAELELAAGRLAPGGRLAVLAPAHAFLFSPFDAAIGHFRRYSAAGLRAVGPESCRLIVCRMLDSAGLLASLGNRAILRSAAPTSGQIAFWDTVLVPLSRVTDALTFHRLGKSVLAVWSRR